MVGALVASAAFAVVVEPSVVVPARSGFDFTGFSSVSLFALIRGAFG
jgi:hypothetical protein